MNRLGLLSDHRVGGLDDDDNRVANLECQAIDRGQTDGRRHRLAAADINYHLSRHSTTDNLLDRSLELISRAEFHYPVPPNERHAGHPRTVVALLFTINSLAQAPCCQAKFSPRAKS